MKTMTEEELDQWVAEMQSFVGWEFRQFRYDEKCIQIQWSNSKEFVWMTFSMKPGVPFVFVSTERIPLAKNLKKPLSQFLKTHFVGRELQSCFRDLQKGRALKVCFKDNDKPLALHFLLIPGRVNIQAEWGEKSVYANKPKAIPLRQEGSEFPTDRQPRASSAFLKTWLQWHSKTEPNQIKEPSKKELKKKKSGYEKMLSHLEKLKTSPWQELGEWLKEHQTLDTVPEDWTQCLDQEQPLAWNIENCFSQAKKNHSKVQGTEDRLLQLEKEIESLEAGKAPASTKNKTPSLLSVAKSKGKTVVLKEGRIFIGKSGPENLKLLRKAKPWYYWLHIKDYPGAYGIVERNKGQKLSQNSLENAALAVVHQSLPKGAEGIFQVLYAECRYVRPIKGAKAGQVTYSHEKVLSVRVGE